VLDDHPIQGETITIEATVANMGYIEADRTVIKFFEGARSTGHGGTEIGEPQVIFDLGKFQSKKVTTSWNLSGFTGEHEIWAVIDEVEPPEIVISNNAMNCSIIIRSENQLPVARLTVIPEGVLYTGDTLFFDGRNSTDDISVKLYLFDFDDGNTSGWISNSELYYQYQTPGTFIASLKVKDTDGAISTNLAQKKLTIKQTVEPVPNRAPVIDRFTANPIEVEVQESVNLKIIAHDPDDDELTYHLQADNGELKNNELSSSATWTAPSTAGTFSISARVFDGELYSESITTEINVYKETKNHMPVIQQIVLDPTEVVIGSSVSITVTAYDPDPDDVLSYNYEVTDGNILGEGSRVIWRTPDVPDIYFIKVEVVDNGGLYDEDEILVNVIEINYEPEILDSDVEPSTIREDKGETVLFTIELFDENGLDDIYSVKIDLSSLGGKSTQKMYDNGKYGDIQSGDGIYSYEHFVSRGMSVGEVTITITIKDLAMNEVIYDVELEIEKGKGEDATGGTFLPGFEGNLTIICMGCIIIFLSIIKRKKYKK
jgi:hypothetical protein